DGVSVINDAYNANPESMRAALRTLAELGGSGARRTWAVLGEMLELGDDSVLEHDAVGRVAVRLNISRLLVVGAGARAMHVGAVMEGSWGNESMFFADADAAYQVLAAELEPGDVVLVKSSNGSGLRFLGDRIALPTGIDPTSISDVSTGERTDRP
ncbi:MAG: cyanophycin synthetase, partial [Specibacter sp.]